MSKKKSTKFNIPISRDARCDVEKISSDNLCVVWVFDNVDRNGEFSFLLNRIESDGNLKCVFDKMMNYESMT